MPVRVVGILELNTTAWHRALGRAQNSLNDFESGVTRAGSRGSRELSNLSSAARKAERELSDLKRQANETSAALRNEFARAMTVGVTLPVSLGVAAAVKFASSWQETENKVKVAFGNQAEAVKAWAQANAVAFGQTSTEAKIAASDFALILKNANLTGEEIARMSTGLVRLASDLSSLHDIDPSDVLVKLRAGLVGEAEPLRRIGILVEEEAIKREAARMGLAKYGKELTSAEKIMARYSRIMIDSKVAHGDFARTQEDLKNSFRRLTAQLKEEATALGVQWLPFLTKFVRGLRELTTAFSDLPGPVKNALVALAGLAAVVGPLMHLKGAMDAVSALVAIKKAIPGAAGTAASTAAAYTTAKVAADAAKAGGTAAVANTVASVVGEAATGALAGAVAGRLGRRGRAAVGSVDAAGTVTTPSAAASSPIKHQIAAEAAALAAEAALDAAIGAGLEKRRAAADARAQRQERLARDQAEMAVRRREAANFEQRMKWGRENRAVLSGPDPDGFKRATREILEIQRRGGLSTVATNLAGDTVSAAAGGAVATAAAGRLATAKAAIASAGGIPGILKTVAATIFSVAAIKVIAAAVVATALVSGAGWIGSQLGRQFWSKEERDRERNLNRAINASNAIAEAQPGLMERRKNAGLAYYDTKGNLVPGSVQGLGSYGVPNFKSTRPAVDPQEEEKARKAAAAAARKRAEDIHEMMEARFASRMDAGRVRAYGAPAGVQNQAEAASLIPIIREEQQRLMKLLQGQHRNTRAYWERVKIIWQLEEQAQDLAKDAVTERTERIKTAWKKQEEQARQIFETRLLRAESIAGQADEGKRAQAELQQTLPVLRNEQGRSVAVAARVLKGSEEYWDAVKQFWNIEGRITQLTNAALTEQREATEKQQTQRRAEKELLEERVRMLKNIGTAAQEDRKLFEEQLKLRAMQIGANPFLNPAQRQAANQQMFLARYRMAATPSIGETPEQRVERLQELEQLRFAGYQSIGAGRWGRRGNRWVPLFDTRRAGNLSRMFAGIEQSAMQAQMGGPNTGEAFRDYAWGSLGEGGPLPQMLAAALREMSAGRGPNIFNLNVSQEGNIFTDPRAQAMLFHQLRGALDTWSRQIAPGFAP